MRSHNALPHCPAIEPILMILPYETSACTVLPFRVPKKTPRRLLIGTSFHSSDVIASMLQGASTRALLGLLCGSSMSAASRTGRSSLRHLGHPPGTGKSSQRTLSWEVMGATIALSSGRTLMLGERPLPPLYPSPQRRFERRLDPALYAPTTRAHHRCSS